MGVGFNDLTMMLGKQPSQSKPQEPSATLPYYWQDEVNDTVAKIKSIQENGDHSVVCFGLVSDIHMDDGTYPFCKNIGKVAAAVMKECDIPVFVNDGDLLTGNTAKTKEEILSCYDTLNKVLSPIGDDHLLSVFGNHDGAYGYSTNANGEITYYDYSLTDGELYNKVFRRQAKDFRRVFGPDGVYFYLDNIPQKFRMICLDGRFVKYVADTDGTTIINRQKSGGFGGNQLNWLVHEALNMEEGWTAAIFTHIPPLLEFTERDYNIFRSIITNFCNKTKIADSSGNLIPQTYTGAYEWMNVSVNIDFTAAKGELLGIFCGHKHQDFIYPDVLPCPITTTICATRYEPYDGSADLRIEGTSTETAMDFFCINTQTHDIHIIRCGIGDDRLLTHGGSTPDDIEPDYTNFADLTSKDWKTDHRCNSVGVVAFEGLTVTNFIQCEKDDYVYVYGLDMENVVNGQTPKQQFHASTIGNLSNVSLVDAGWYVGKTDDGGYIFGEYGADENRYYRFCGAPINGEENIIIKVKRNGAWL
ncbi:MAG: hypothetical protein E7645_00225 [Ruminococcaceae bacterium]|nr:hypothetical protein [Oscillospiraceae bacterium]